MDPVEDQEQEVIEVGEEQIARYMDTPTAAQQSDLVEYVPATFNIFVRGLSGTNWILLVRWT